MTSKSVFDRSAEFKNAREKFLANPLTGLAFKDEAERQLGADCYAEGVVACMEEIFYSQGHCDSRRRACKDRKCFGL